MSSVAQTLANQANAQLSTGPRTVEGKVASSRNATKHGFRSRLHVRSEEQEEFELLVESHRAELDPHGPLENLIFDKIISSAWHLLRLEWAETELLKNGEGEFPYCHPDALPTLDTIYRYRLFHERALFRALKELRTLQNERALRQQVNEPATDALPVLAESAQIAKRTQFFSSESVLRYFNRASQNDVNRMMHQIAPARPLRS